MEKSLMSHLIDLMLNMSINFCELLTHVKLLV